MERTFELAFIGSLCIHLGLMLGDVPWMHFKKANDTPIQHTLMEVVYEYERVKAQRIRLEQKIAELQDRGAASIQEYQAEVKAREVRIPERPSLLDPSSLFAEDAAALNAPVIDLSALEEALNADPLLMGYCSTIRMQIQRTAGKRDWLAGLDDSGVVYVSFILSADGRISGLKVAADKSQGPVASLGQVALTIVQASAPFPAFMPSMGQQHLTIVVPLEFL